MTRRPLRAYALLERGVLRRADFSGGEVTVARTLERLGFEIERPTTAGLPDSQSGIVYTWDQLAETFRFKPSLFQVGGGMLSRLGQRGTAKPKTTSVGIASSWKAGERDV